MFLFFSVVIESNRRLGAILIFTLIVDILIYLFLELFVRLWVWESSKWVAKWALWGQFYLDELKREHLARKNCLPSRVEALPMKVSAHNVAAVQRREWKQHMRRCPHSQETATAEEIAPEHPSIRTLLGFTDQEILGMAEGLQGALQGSPKCPTPSATWPIPSQVTWRSGWMSGKDRTAWCDGDSPVLV